MELRVLQYFLAIAREESITGAANALHLSQPTLSRQIKDMEKELGTTLLIRSNRKVELTEEGRILRKRAEEILELANRTEKEISMTKENIAGDIYIGAGETEGIRPVIKAMTLMQEQYADVHFHISSGDTMDVRENLDKGIIDFGIIFGNPGDAKYDFMEIPYKETWGVLMHRDMPLAKKKIITESDLAGKPLIVSRAMKGPLLSNKYLADMPFKQEDIIGTYSLLFNASIMAEEKLGYVLCLDKIINTEGKNTVFCPLENNQPTPLYIYWKKYQIFPRATEKFLGILKNLLNNKEPSDFYCSHTFCGE